MELPPIEKYEITPRKWVDVVRCNKIDGGLKRFAIEGVYSKVEPDNVVFPSNSYGLGGLALTLSLQGSGKHPIIFLSKNDTLSPDLERCQAMGAELDFSGNALPFDSENLRHEAVAKYSDKQYEVLPLGLENAQVRANIAGLARSMFPFMPPSELWVTTASGPDNPLPPAG